MSTIKPTPDSLCVRCASTEAKAAQGEEICFTLEPLQHGQISEMLSHSAALPDSAAITYQFNEAGKNLATLHTLSKNGQPVTTETIKSLCGGQAPHVWHQKRIAMTPASQFLTPIDGALLLTADNQMYDFNLFDHAFDYTGSRSLVSAGLATDAAITEDLAILYRHWLHDGGLLCSGREPSMEDALLAMEGQLAPADMPMLDQVHCDAPYEIPPALSALAVEGRILADRAFARVSARYLAADDASVRMQFCPVLTGQAWAWYDANEGVISVPLDVFQQKEYQRATPHDRQKILEVLLAHEIGHHRHVTAAGLKQSSAHEYTSAYGIPATIAFTLNPLIAEWELPPFCASEFVQSLNGYGSGGPSLGHAPGHGEIVARFYELDHLSRESHAMSPGTRDFLAGQLDSSIQELADNLLYHYSAFPLAASELGVLYAAALLDPQLGAASQDIGARLAIGMGADLPEGAADVSYGVPLAAIGPAERATFSPKEQRRIARLSDYSDAVASQRRRLHQR